jgi:hypothetical protein
MQKGARDMRTVGAACAAIAVSVGCQSQPNDELVAVEHNELGITQVEIDHDVVNGERVLTVRGLENDGDQVATATLRTGMVRYGADMPEDWHPGTELTITVGEHSASYVSPDREAHTVGGPDNASLEAFIRLAPVSSAIEQEAGIRFADRHVDEVAFAAAACNGANFPVANGNPSQCCMDGVNIYHKIASGSNLNKLAWRETGTACRTSGGATGCTSDCYYGPCAARVVGVAGTNTTAAAVFTPTSAPTQCGRDSNGSSAGGGMEAPEAYTGSQTLKSGVTASCTATQCIPTGEAGNRLTVNNVGQSGNTGRADSSSSGYGGYPNGINTFTTSIPTDFADFPAGLVVQVWAQHTISGRNVVISGACSASGSSIAACNVTIGSGDKTVTVTFQ